MEGLLKPLEEATNIIGEEIGEGISQIFKENPESINIEQIQKDIQRDIDVKTNINVDSYNVLKQSGRLDEILNIIKQQGKKMSSIRKQLYTQILEGRLQNITDQQINDLEYYLKSSFFPEESVGTEPLKSSKNIEELLQKQVDAKQDYKFIEKEMKQLLQDIQQQDGKFQYIIDKMNLKPTSLQNFKDVMKDSIMEDAQKQKDLILDKEQQIIEEQKQFVKQDQQEVRDLEQQIKDKIQKKNDYILEHIKNSDHLADIDKVEQYNKLQDINENTIQQNIKETIFDKTPGQDTLQQIEQKGFSDPEAKILQFKNITQNYTFQNLKLFNKDISRLTQVEKNQLLTDMTQQLQKNKQYLEQFSNDKTLQSAPHSFQKSRISRIQNQNKKLLDARQKLADNLQVTPQPIEEIPESAQDDEIGRDHIIEDRVDNQDYDQDRQHQDILNQRQGQQQGESTFRKVGKNLGKAAIAIGSEETVRNIISNKIDEKIKEIDDKNKKKQEEKDKQDTSNKIQDLMDIIKKQNIDHQQQIDKLLQKIDNNQMDKILKIFEQQTQKQQQINYSQIDLDYLLAEMLEQL